MENKPATKEQLIALRDALLAWHDKDAAAAVDNVIDILSYGNKASLFDIENNVELDMARDWEAQKTELRGG